MKHSFIAFVLAFGLQAQAHHEQCADQERADYVRCMAQQGRELLPDQWAQFKAQVASRAEYRSGLELFKILVYQNRPVGFESNQERLIFGVYGHGPGGDREGYFIYRLFPVFAPSIQLEIVGTMTLPSAGDERLVVKRFQEVRVKL